LPAEHARQSAAHRTGDSGRRPGRCAGRERAPPQRRPARPDPRGGRNGVPHRRYAAGGREVLRDGEVRPMTVIVNGVEVSLHDDATVSTAVQTLPQRTSGVAVALNGEVVSKSAWSSTRLSTGDEIEVLTAVQGG